MWYNELNAEKKNDMNIKEKLIADSREEYLTGLESLAQFLLSHPKLPLPPKDFIDYIWSKDALVEFAKGLEHADKEYEDNYVTVSKSFGPIKYGRKIPREKVCESRVVGKKTVPFRDAYLIPATPEHEEDVIEWDCKPLLDTDEEN